MSEFRIGGLLFTSKFDSGNLAHVEKVQQQSSNINNLSGGDHEYSTSSANNGANPGSNPTQVATAVGGDQQSSPLRNGGQVPSGGYPCSQPDLEVNMWTKRDAAGTEFENGNRTWFYFAVKGAPAGKYVKMNIMNLNRQFRLFQQGMSPVYRVLPQKPNWDRIREKPAYMNVDEADFMISFCHRFEYKNSSVEFAFCFPFSYTEYQKWMTSLDAQFQHCRDNPPITTREESPDAIYYHRELAIRSLDNNRVDLITVSSYDGISEEREHEIPHLFPDTSADAIQNPRPYRFRHKKVFFLSSRVHPGETPSSFVFNGFLKFILREEDPRAIALRRMFVFKLIPMLNPDGVISGNYRTDSRGMNLNRVYLDPDVTYHSPIYAARQIMFYHHIFNSVANPNDSTNERNTPSGGSDKENNTTAVAAVAVPNSANSAASSGSNGATESKACPCIVGRGTSELCCRNDQPISKIEDTAYLSSVGHKNSGLAYYVDLHGHASKRGCFMYGNHVENITDHVENLLYPKLISLNSAHFDFGGCNFTEKNMYMKDKRDGASKEGAGRVAMFKILGLIHSYTLECNYNTGRQTNCIASASNDDGRATPPPPVSFPPRYGIYHYEDVGKAVAIAALDMAGMNPWSRIAMSEYMNVHSCRLWVHRFVQGLYNGPGVPRKTNAKNNGPKPMAHTYLSHFDKEDVQSGVSSVLARNRFPLRNNRLQQQQLLHNQSMANISSSDPGAGGGNPYLANASVTSTFSTNRMGSVNGNGGVSATTGTAGNSNAASQAAKNLGPIRENKAFQMRRQRLLQLNRTIATHATTNANNNNNASVSAQNSVNNNTTATNAVSSPDEASTTVPGGKLRLHGNKQEVSPSLTSTPNHFLSSNYASQQDSSLAQPNALKHILGHQHSKTQQANQQNPNTARAVYNLPITTATPSYSQSVLGPNLDAGAALAYLSNKHPGANLGHPLGAGNNSTIAGLAIISPRKAHTLIQKASPPPGSNQQQQQQQVPFTRTRFGINRSLSVLQQNPNSDNLLYSSAGSSSNVTAQNNMDLNAVYAAFERTSTSNNNNSGMFKKTSYSQNDLTNVGRNPTTSRLPETNTGDGNDQNSCLGVGDGRRSKMYLRPVSASSVENDDEYSSDTRYLTEGFSGNQSAMMVGLAGGDKKIDQMFAAGNGGPAKVTADSNLTGGNSAFERIPSSSASGKKNEKKKSVGNNSGSIPTTSNSKVPPNSATQGIKSSNSENAANISRPATCKSGMDANAATTAAMQLLSKGSVSSTPATAALNLRKLSIKSASSSNNATPAVKRRKSSKRSGGANSGSGGSAVSA